MTEKSRTEASVEQSSRSAASLLTPASQIVSSNLGKSSKTKAAFAERRLREFASRHNMKDPDEISPKSSDLIINLLYEYSGMSLPDPNHKTLKGRESISGLINGLRWTYRNAGHTEFWSV